MSGTQRDTLFYFPSLWAEKRVWFSTTGEASDGTGLGGRIGYTNLSHPHVCPRIPRTAISQLGLDMLQEVSMSSSNLHTQVLPEARFWSQYVVTV